MQVDVMHTQQIAFTSLRKPKMDEMERGKFKWNELASFRYATRTPFSCMHCSQSCALLWGRHSSDRIPPLFSAHAPCNFNFTCFPFPFLGDEQMSIFTRLALRPSHSRDLSKLSILIENSHSKRLKAGTHFLLIQFRVHTYTASCII